MPGIRSPRHSSIVARNVLLPSLLLIVATCFAMCSSPAAPTPPPPPPQVPGPPRISCPAGVEVQSPDGSGVTVSYPAPAVTDGAPPVAVACTMASGATFPVGKTEVSCTATDARQRTADCSFGVTVLSPPWLSATRLLAFGDSITDGVVSAPLTFALVAVPESYPAKLEVMLVARYVLQNPSVINAGVSGERATAGALRLPELVNRYHPDAVLLMEGANDLSFWGAPGISIAISALAGMVDDARQRGAQVFLATLPPQRGRSTAALVPEFNRGVKDVAAAEGAVLVDVHDALAADIDRYIGADGLHPTEAGYGRIAEAFFEAVRSTLETPMPLPSSVGPAR